MSDAEAVQAALVSRMCPWCDRGPFHSLAAHTQKAHGVHADDLRRLAGLSRYQSVASPELSAEAGERGRVKRHLKGHERHGGRTFATGYEAVLQIARLAIDSAQRRQPVDPELVAGLVAELHPLHPLRR